MKKKNLLTRVLDNKILCLAFLIAAFIDGIVFLYWGGNDPMSEDGTASLVGADYPFAFWVWTLLTVGGFYLNTRILYKKYDNQSKALNIVAILGGIGLFAVACTLGHFDYDNEPINAKVIIHWGGMFLFGFGYGLSLIWFFVKNMKKVKSFRIIGVLIGVMMLVLILLLVFKGKSGMLEAIPLEILLLLMFFTNYTNLFKYEKPAEQVSESKAGAQ